MFHTPSMDHRVIMLMNKYLLTITLTTLLRSQHLKVEKTFVSALLESSVSCRNKVLTCKPIATLAGLNNQENARNLI